MSVPRPQLGTRAEDTNKVLSPNFRNSWCSDTLSPTFKPVKGTDDYNMEVSDDAQKASRLLKQWEGLLKKADLRPGSGRIRYM